MMEKGMPGILLVSTLSVISVITLNKVTSGKKKNDSNDKKRN